MADKIIGYEQAPATHGWTWRSLFVADNTDSAGSFPDLSNDLIDQSFPASNEPRRVHLGVTHADPAAARSEILAAIDRGDVEGALAFLHPDMHMKRAWVERPCTVVLEGIDDRSQHAIGYEASRELVGSWVREAAADPGETKNLATIFPEKYAEMIQLWRQERRRMGITLPGDL